MAIEVKARERVARKDLRGLIALGEEGVVRRQVVVAMEPRPRRVDGIDILPWARFLEELWQGGFQR